jgi:hypothetical protein
VQRPGLSPISRQAEPVAHRQANNKPLNAVGTLLARIYDASISAKEKPGLLPAKMNQVCTVSNAGEFGKFSAQRQHFQTEMPTTFSRMRVFPLKPLDSMRYKEMPTTFKLVGISL